jgi:hypothetical protein
VTHSAADAPTPPAPSPEEATTIAPPGAAAGTGVPATAETVPAADATAVVDPDATVVEQPVDATPRFRERTRMRRRMRELRRLRELAFRDLGGLAFDLHRFGRDRPDLLTEKLQSLAAIDAELRAIEGGLDERRPVIELREAGVAACPRCGTLHGTDANFCPGCGTPLRGSVVHEAGPLRVTPVDQPTASP